MTEKIHTGYVLEMLISTGRWTSSASEYEDIVFLEATPITKAEYEAGVIAYPAWKAEQEAKALADKAALLAKLGLTADEFKTLLGGN